MNKYGVILFHTTSAVMKAEKALAIKGFYAKLIPTPREFSSDCGIALQFEADKIDQVKVVLDEQKLDTESIHLL